MITINEGDVVDFNLVTNSILGGKRTGVQVKSGLLDYSLAVQLDPELNSKHANMYPFFQEKVQNVNNPASYKYFAVTNAQGKNEIIGVPWVLDTSFKPIATRQVTYVIHNFQENMRGAIETLFSNLGASFTSLDETNK